MVQLLQYEVISDVAFAFAFALCERTLSAFLEGSEAFVPQSTQCFLSLVRLYLLDRGFTRTQCMGADQNGPDTDTGLCKRAIHETLPW